MLRFIFLLFVLLPLLLPAQHTFSIVAFDPVTREIGAAGATCLTSNDCGGCGGAIIISEIVPNLGAINAQATVCIPNVNAQNGANQLGTGTSASAVLTSLLAFDACIFGDTSDRQYGIVSLGDTIGMPDATGFTGSNALNYAGHLTGPNYAIQGNILLGPQILDSMETRFLNSTGPLCERLMAALQGANVIGADSRCQPDGVSSKSAFIRVAKPSDAPGNLWLDLNVPIFAPGTDPIDSLQIKFDAWKLANGSPSPTLSQLEIYPNPSQEGFFVRPEGLPLGKYQLEVVDPMGRQVFEDQWETGNGAFRIITQNWKSGVYWVKIKGMAGNEQRQAKVLVW